MVLLAFVKNYVQRVYPPRAPVYAPWTWFVAVLLVILAGGVVLVCLPFWVWKDSNRYNPPLTRAERRRKMRS